MKDPIGQAIAAADGRDKLSDAELDTVVADLRDGRTTMEFRAVLSLMALRSALARRLTPYPCAQVNCKRVLDPRPAETMTLDERVFDSWLRVCLGKRATWTAAEALDALIDLGYENQARDFRANVNRLAHELTVLNRHSKRHLVHTWTSVLATAAKLGWHRRDG